MRSNRGKRGIQKSSTSLQVADLESTTRGRKVEKDGDTPQAPRVSIHIHSIRHRATDPDGVSAKAAIDTLVNQGVLSDDGIKFVEAVSFSQEVTKKAKEATIITLYKEE